MGALGDMLDRVRGLDLERSLGLRAECPRLAIGFDRQGLVLARLGRARRGGGAALEAAEVVDVDAPPVPATLFEPVAGELALGEPLARLFERTGTKPGKISIVLPDNLAKLSLLRLPEWPPSRRQLEEILRFRMRRAVPFRLDEAAMTYQVFPAADGAIEVLVALVRRELIERFERVVEAVGCRPGLVDLATPNLLNLCGDRIEGAAAEGDVALLNSADTYFTLTIIRDGAPIFVRCKSLAIAPGERDAEEAGRLLVREIGGSMAYYREKLDGRGVGTLLVRSVSEPPQRIAERLSGVGVARVEPVEPAARVTVDEAAGLDFEARQRLAPVIGAALGRS